VIVWQSYLQWNYYRSGSAFVTAETTNLLMPLIAVQERGVEVFDKSPELSTAYRFARRDLAEKANPKMPTESVVRSLLHILRGEPADRPAIAIFDRMLPYLYRNQGIHIIEVDRLTRIAYFRLLLSKPNEILLHASRIFWPQAAVSVIKLTDTLKLFLRGNSREKNVSSKEVEQMTQQPGSLQTLAWAGIVFAIVEAGVSIFLAAVFILILPISAIWALRIKAFNKEHLAIGWNWIVYVAFTMMYCIVHFETRYTMLLQALVLVGSFVLMSWVGGYRRWRDRESAGGRDIIR
jgi:hypothetical protein